MTCKYFKYNNLPRRHVRWHAYVDGLTSIATLYDPRCYSLYPAHEQAVFIASDWDKIGKDIYAAIVTYGRQFPTVSTGVNATFEGDVASAQHGHAPVVQGDLFDPQPSGRSVTPERRAAVRN